MDFYKKEGGEGAGGEASNDGVLVGNVTLGQHGNSAIERQWLAAERWHGDFADVSSTKGGRSSPSCITSAAGAA